MRCEWTEEKTRPGFWFCCNCGIPYGGLRGHQTPMAKPISIRICKPKPLKKERMERIIDAPVRKHDEPLKGPSVKKKLKNYKGARAAWKRAGKPTRSLEERAIIMERCKACPSNRYIDKPVVPGGDGGQCADCGCGLAAVRDLLNATAWATWKCKRGHWDDLPITFVDPPTGELIPEKG